MVYPTLWGQRLDRAEPFPNKSEFFLFEKPSEWEKIIASEATDKELISKINKQLLQLNFRKINDPIKNWPKN